MITNKYLKQSIITFVLVGLLILTTLLFSFAIFNPTFIFNNNIDNTITTGIFSINYLEGDKFINIENALPKSDIDGKSQIGKNEYFDFIINAQTDGVHPIGFTITVEKDSTSTLPNEWIKVFLTKVNYGTENWDKSTLSLFSDCNKYNNLQNEKILYAETISTKNYRENFRFKMWIKDTKVDDNDFYTGKKFKAKINVYAS